LGLWSDDVRGVIKDGSVFRSARMLTRSKFKSTFLGN